MNCKWLGVAPSTGRALRIVVPYMAAAGLWIGLSDAIALWLAADAGVYARLQAWKGTGFVLATGLLLHVLMREQFVRSERSHAKARNLATRLRRMLESLDDLIFVFDDRLRFADAYYPDHSAQLMPPEHFMGRTADEMGMPAEIGRALERVRDECSTQPIDYALDMKGGRFWYSAKLSPMTDENGKFVGVIAVVRDITGLKSSEQRFRRLFEDLNNVAVQGYDADRRVVFWNTASEALYGYSREEALGRRFEELIIPPAFRDEAIRMHDDWVVKDKPIPSGELELLHRDGELIPVFCCHTMLRNECGEAEMYCVDVDLRELRETQAQLRRAATHDPLTGLPNRMLARDRFDQAMALAVREQTLLALLFVDLDRFKRINDSLGHDAGDAVLRDVAARLQASVRAGDTIARWGGDEFIILLDKLEDRNAVIAVALKVLEILDREFEADGNTGLLLSCSIGISVGPEDSPNAETLLSMADKAMYRGKIEGGSRYTFYSPEMNTWSRDRLDMETALHHGLANQEFELFYQPQIEIASGRLAGLESLIRWQRPGKGRVMPDEFITAAEESGIIRGIGEWAIHAAMRQTAHWNREGLLTVPLAVNVSARQFSDMAIVDTIREGLADSGLAPSMLKVELTESTAMRNPGYAAELLHSIHNLGVSIAVDDFGTGYSSLSLLKRFPVSELKIDRSFVGDVSDHDAAAIVRGTIALAHGLGMTVVAEGVETQAQLRFLADHGCDVVQGYLFAQPLPPDEIRNWLSGPPPHALHAISLLGNK